MLRSYDIDVRRMRLVQYEDNAVYFVEGSSGKDPGETALYMLRISVRDGRSPAEQNSELDWMAALVADKAVTVPAPVATRSSGKVVTVEEPGWPEPATAVVFEWIPGRASPPYGRPRVAGELGAITARLHEHASGFRPPAGFVRPSWGHADVFENGAAMTDPTARDRLREDERRTLREVCAAVRERLPEQSAADWGVIHADLHRGNLVGTPDGTVAVIDFDDCGWGFYMLDVATVLSSVLRTCRKEPGAYDRFAEGYLDGYRSVRELPPAAARFDEFLVMRDMIILNFVLGSRNAAVLSWGPQRAQGILRLMQNYLKTGEYDGHLSLAS
ncbi:phosphotransferase enzyme family protein [Streptomyces sp. NPDC001678]|uniref:phosphotransferase enzyme family protein n=1 Tax=Streptomyces sp. NPDC001678 TaxID=3364599 RepID=UPI0036BB22F7